MSGTLTPSIVRIREVIMLKSTTVPSTKTQIR
jgi:hypothetical protein